MLPFLKLMCAVLADDIDSGAPGISVVDVRGPGWGTVLPVLERYCTLLFGSRTDIHGRMLKKDMTTTVFELLTHNWCQAFANPSSFKAPMECYSMDATLTAPKLAPLLGDNRALGCENVRVVAMDMLAFVATDHHMLIRNPIAKNQL